VSEGPANEALDAILRMAVCSECGQPIGDEGSIEIWQGRSDREQVPAVLAAWHSPRCMTQERPDERWRRINEVMLDPSIEDDDERERGLGELKDEDW
jgi:hypothetical protein